VASEPMISIRGLEVACGGFRLGPLDLHVAHKEFFAVVGPTGAGKTMLLEAVAGLVEPRRGAIFLEGLEITGLAPERRPVSIVYQDFSLFPHLDVQGNIEFGLRYIKGAGNGGQGSGDRAGDGLVEELMDRLGISHLSKRGVVNLSGGEKQRVALARALAVRPRLLLLDEPLSSLDPSSRQSVRGLLGQIHRAFGTTVIMVTHDFSDLFALADRVAVMNRGRIEQSGSVEEVFSRPATSFVADFTKGAVRHGDHAGDKATAV